MHLILTHLLLALAAPQSIVYVDQTATGGNNGSSWSNAYTDLQAALGASTSGEIWVAEGNYLPGVATASFVLKDGVALYGGFLGWETSVALRAGSTEKTVLDGGGINYHVVRAENVSSTAVLDGFWISNGYAIGSSGFDAAGGGMLLVNASPLIRGCVVADCIAVFAGGVYLAGGSPVFEDCEIRNNWGYLYNGGGIYQVSGNAQLLRCMISGNRGSNSVQGAGGGLYVSGGAVDAVGCVFEGNEANDYFGVFYAAVGGGAFLGSDGSTFTNCSFLGNSSHVGGGATCYGDTTFTNCVFSGNEAYSVDTGFTSVGGYGGAIDVWLNNLVLEGCSISGNNATEDCGGVFVDYGSLALIESSVIWGNTDTGSTEVVKRNLKEGPGVNADLRWSCVEGLDPLGYLGCTALDPRFVDPDGVDNLLGTLDDQLRLLVGSPCVDSGSNAGFTGVTTDLDGMPRLVDDPSTWDRGFGTAPVADMGAYEFTGHGPLLALSALQRGQPVALTVTDAEPGEVVNYYYSFRGLGAGPALPLYGGMNLDLLNPTGAIGTTSADAAGNAVFQAVMPANAPLRTVYIQAAIARGVGGADSVRTNPASTTILP
jgi:hypothetical protein